LYVHITCHVHKGKSRFSSSFSGISQRFPGLPIWSAGASQDFLDQKRQAGRQDISPAVAKIITTCGRCLLVFKTSRRLEKSRQWVGFPYTSALVIAEVLLHFCRDWLL